MIHVRIMANGETYYFTVSGKKEEALTERAKAMHPQSDPLLNEFLMYDGDLAEVMAYAIDLYAEALIRRKKSGPAGGNRTGPQEIIFQLKCNS